MDTDLERRAHALLAQASVIAEAPGVSYIPFGHGQHDSAEPTSGRGGNLHDAIVRRFARCATDTDLKQAITWADQQLEGVRRSPNRPTMPFKQRILEEWEGHHYANVAHITSTPPTTIRRWRKESGYDPLYGRRART